jgi:predicted DNA-binding transcriptional regulator YafY
LAAIAMSRSARLLDLLQALRTHRRPVTAEALARDLGVSVRTVYRDIGTLVGQGAPIDGEAGVGYVLKPGFLLPPLMFDDDEIEALVLGLRFVVQRGDRALGDAAVNALAKITAVLPQDLRDAVAVTGLLAGPGRDAGPDHAAIRLAIRTERKLRLGYRDRNGKASQRVVWPIALGYFDSVSVLAAWCEMRQDFRHFRTDRIIAAVPTSERYPRRRGVLLAEWRKRENIPDRV